MRASAIWKQLAPVGSCFSGAPYNSNGPAVNLYFAVAFSFPNGRALRAFPLARPGTTISKIFLDKHSLIGREV